MAGKVLQLAPSILTADFGRLADEIRSVEEWVDWFHLDVMDGHYVPNVTFGASTVAAINDATEKPLHVHLMISDPDAFAAEFVAAGADRVSFHPEVTDRPETVIETIRTAGAGAGLALHPDVGVDAAVEYVGEIEVVLMMTVRPGFGGQAFLPEVVPKIRDIVGRIQQDARIADIDVEVDGGVNLDTVDETVDAGGNIIVAGSAIFDGIDPPAAAKRLRARLEELEKGPKGWRDDGS